MRGLVVAVYQEVIEDVLTDFNLLQISGALKLLQTSSANNFFKRRARIFEFLISYWIQVPVSGWTVRGMHFGVDRASCQGLLSSKNL